jgi:hypothetical protein
MIPRAPPWSRAGRPFARRSGIAWARLSTRPSAIMTWWGWRRWMAARRNPIPAPRFLQFTGQERTYRSLDAAGCHIILLDPFEITGDALRYRGVIGPEQLAWLRDDVAGVDPRTPIVVMVHMPLMTGFFQATEGATASAPANRVVVNSGRCSSFSRRIIWFWSCRAICT